MNHYQPISIPEDLRQMYIGRRKAEILEIMNCLRSNDYEQIALLGHRMKGNGVSFGFPEISRLGERIETQAKSGQRDEVETSLHELIAWVGRQKLIDSKYEWI